MRQTEHRAGPVAVLHVPHASLVVPRAERMSILLSDEELQLELLRMTDRYTDELFAVDATVAHTVLYPVSRLVVDPERFVDDELEPMARRGMGVIYTHTSQRTPLRSPPLGEERECLLAQHYHPHHERLTRAVDDVLDAHGRCLVLDCHSFASRALPYELDQSDDRPEICIGTDGAHTPSWLLEAACRFFSEAGFSVAIDRPFAGALVPAKHYKVDRRVLALMVEVNRGVYMDEGSGERLAGFADVQRRVQDCVRSLLDLTSTA